MAPLGPQMGQGATQPAAKEPASPSILQRPPAAPLFSHSRTPSTAAPASASPTQIHPQAMTSTPCRISPVMTPTPSPLPRSAISPASLHRSPHLHPRQRQHPRQLPFQHRPNRLQHQQRVHWLTPPAHQPTTGFKATPVMKPSTAVMATTL